MGPPCDAGLDDCLIQLTEFRCRSMSSFFCESPCTASIALKTRESSAWFSVGMFHSKGYLHGAGLSLAHKDDKQVVVEQCDKLPRGRCESKAGMRSARKLMSHG